MSKPYWGTGNNLRLAVELLLCVMIDLSSIKQPRKKGIDLEDWFEALRVVNLVENG
jgi:hypothetical protein